MKNTSLCLRFVLAAICAVLAGEAGALERSPLESLSDQVSEVILKRLHSGRNPEPAICMGESLCLLDRLRVFYGERLFRPVWSGQDGPFPVGEDVIRELGNADLEGLRPEDYHLSALESLLRELRAGQVRDAPPNPEKLADLDLLLTDAFLMYASHLLRGKVNPKTLETQWYLQRRKGDPSAPLEAALHSHLIKETLQGLHPPYAGYGRLRQALAHYRSMAERGGWEAIPAGETLRRGDQGPRVAAVRQRLILLGDLDQDRGGEDGLFDETMECAVKRFQTRHGLASDGIVGIATLTALNVPMWKRASQIQWNMERWRWLPESLGGRYILVNITDFHLEVRDGERRVMRMRAIVGTPYRRTPVFAARMTYLVLNPHWNVPANIVKEELLPEIQKSVEYLRKNNIKIFRNHNGRKAELDPNTVDWSTFNSNGLPFLFRQEAGPSNPLGRIKFMLENEFEVYLHDTPHRQLFTRTARQFSHGCIRIERPMELAEYLLQEDPRWTREALDAALKSEVDKTVRLPKPMDVYILYWTAWVDEDGTVQFREDIYEQDGPLAVALDRRPPRP